MAKKHRGKLELNWVDKGDIIVTKFDDNGKTYPASYFQGQVTDEELMPRELELIETVGDPDSENMLVWGENLIALRSLEREFAGKIKVIYIDPPFNTGQDFQNYEDGLEHSIWLSMMKPRIELLHRFLCNDGSLWISIDDDEGHYLKALCDEIFGRKNFVANVIWEKKYSPQNDAKWLSDSHDHILVYAKNKEIWRPNPLSRTDAMDARYKNPDNDPRGLWKSGDLSVKTYTESTDYPIKTPSGRIVHPPESRCWVVTKTRFQELVEDGRIWFGKSGNNVPSIKRFLSEVQEGTVSKTIWYRTEVGDNQEAKKEVKFFNSDNVFTTPKPERLIQRILMLGSREGDRVLDAFLGSGSTTAVSHKMNRKWIGIELGEHCHTHCLPRMKKVVEGSDQGGISKEVNWKGGGGFKFYKLGDPVILSHKDYPSIKIINPKYHNTGLIKVICNLEGFKYKKADKIFHGVNKLGNKYAHITEQYLSQAYVDLLKSKLADNEELIVYCFNYDEKIALPLNILIRKLPGDLGKPYQLRLGI